MIVSCGNTCCDVLQGERIQKQLFIFSLWCTHSFHHSSLLPKITATVLFIATDDLICDADNDDDNDDDDDVRSHLFEQCSKGIYVFFHVLCIQSLEILRVNATILIFVFVFNCIVLPNVCLNIVFSLCIFLCIIINHVCIKTKNKIKFHNSLIIGPLNFHTFVPFFLSTAQEKNNGKN